jgi:hypothetical protein
MKSIRFKVLAMLCIIAAGAILSAALSLYALSRSNDLNERSDVQGEIALVTERINAHGGEFLPVRHGPAPSGFPVTSAQASRSASLRSSPPSTSAMAARSSKASLKLAGNSPTEANRDTYRSSTGPAAVRQGFA